MDDIIEKSAMRKIYLRLLPFAVLSYFLAYIDRINVSFAALTMRGVQKRRPSLYDLVDDMKRMTTPALIVTGDEDEPCLEASLMMKRTIASAGLVVMPRTGHAVNLEEPGLFNSIVEDFLHQAERGHLGFVESFLQ
jgi:pimeloyl-ACP methyl ester carboxylesterase